MNSHNGLFFAKIIMTTFMLSCCAPPPPPQPSVEEVAKEVIKQQAAKQQLQEQQAAELAEEKRREEAAAAEARRQAEAAEAQRIQEEAAAEAQRQALQQDCDNLDNEQRRINEEYAEWKRIYPISSASMISCVKSAKTNDDIGSCLAIACAMAAGGANAESNEGCADFGTRLTTIGSHSEALKERKGKYPSCTFVVPNELG